MYISKDKHELLEALRLVLQGKNVETTIETSQKLIPQKDKSGPNHDVLSDSEDDRRKKLP